MMYSVIGLVLLACCNQAAAYVFSSASTVPYVSNFLGALNVSSSDDGTYGLNAIYTLGPSAVKFDSNGNMIFIEWPLGALRMLTPAGVSSTICPTGSFISFSQRGFCLDSANNIYVADWGNNALTQVLAGTACTKVAWSTAGAIPQATDCAVDTSGHVFVVSYSGATVYKYTAPNVSTTFYARGLLGPLNAASAMTIDSANNLYLGSFLYSTIVKITPAGVASVFAGTSGTPGCNGGTGTSAQFTTPRALTYNPDGWRGPRVSAPRSAYPR